MADTGGIAKPDAKQLAVRYLRSPGAKGFWQWQDEGQVVTDTSGITVIFMEELIPILSWLAPRGLPRFGSLVLLLAACRDNWDMPDDGRTGVFLLSGADHVFGKTFSDWPLVRAGLENVNQLPPQLRNTLKARTCLCDLVFEYSRDRLTLDESLAIVTYLKLEREEGVFDFDPDWSSSTFYLRDDLRELARGLPRILPETVEILLTAGISEPPGDVTIELPPTPSARSLIAQLHDDEQLGGLMAVARDLLATVHLPRQLADPDSLPLGGVSDITNRGPLDRLLISELAHDDEVLATRIALNEALYLRREAPPRQSTDQRTLLLDAGIRLWGKPRLLVCAAGLAVAAASEKNFQIVAWRASGKTLQAVDLTTREGLLEHLAALEPDPYPGDALIQAAAMLAKADDPGEVILVTHQDVLNDPDFRLAVQAAGLPVLFVLAVAQDGTVELHRLTPHRTQHLSTASVSDSRAKAAVLGLTESTSARMVIPPLDPEAIHPDLPLILSLGQFPLLLPPRAKPHRMVYAPGHGILAVGPGGRLQFQADLEHGAAHLDDLVFQGNILAMFPTPEGMVHIPIKSGKALHLVTCDLKSEQCYRQELTPDSGKLPGMAMSGRYLLTTNKIQVQAFATDGTGLVASAIRPAGFVWRHSRFFTDQEGCWYWAYVSADQIKFKLFSGPIMPSGKKIMTLFDQHSAEGPLALVAGSKSKSPLIKQVFAEVVDANGAVLRRVSDIPLEYEGDFNFSPNGRHCWLAADSRKKQTSSYPIFGLDDYHGSRLYDSVNMEPEVGQALNHDRGMHLTKLMSTGVTADGTLYVCTRKGGRYFHFCLGQKTGHLMFLPLHETPAPRIGPQAMVAALFLPMDGGQRTSQVRKCGRWPGLGRAYIDRRGMLHLVSDKPDFPQISLTLVTGQCAAWTTNGKSCGPDYYFRPGPRPHDDRKIFDLLTEFCSRLPKFRGGWDVL